MTPSLERTAALVVVTGPDGCGKSTLLASLKTVASDKPGPTLAYASIFDALNHMQDDGLSLPAVRRYMQDLSPAARWTFLLHALRHSLDLALEQNADIIVFDGYWYKYAVSELALGLPSPLLQEALVLLPKPEKIFTLDCALETLKQRKSSQSATDYERGFAELDMQGKTFAIWQSFWQNPWLKDQEPVRLNAHDHPQQLAQTLWEQLA